MEGAYITDLTQFLDEKGEIPKDVHRDAREMGSFLALVVDMVTIVYPESGAGVETGIRCRVTGCTGEIIGALVDPEEEIHWLCSECGHHGIISNWQGSKWDNTGLPHQFAGGTCNPVG